jgi:TonB-dependent starch-binding outer membrane protein SusC
MQNAMLCTRPAYARNRYITKLLLVMKLTMILLTAAFLNVSAKGVSQQITYSGTNVPLKTVFTEVEKQSGYLFFYDDDVLLKTSPITVLAVDVSLNAFLEQIFKGQPINYVIKDSNIIVSSGKATLPKLLGPPPVTGIIRGPDGKPLAGANVIVKGTKRGTTSNADGTFIIEAKEGDIIIVSSIGYTERQITVRNNNTVGIVDLALSESKLDEIQIIAYGTTSRRLSTGNVSSVDAKDISKSPVQDPLLAIQGRVPGVFIEQSSGLPGGGVKVRIQGQNSLTKGNDPLYVVDGIPYSSDVMPTLNSILGGSGGATPGFSGAGSPLSYINPQNIESISILKDADATSIYGSRAANGAILITTKEGQIGSTRFDVSFQQGLGQISRKLNLMNTQQYLEMRKEAMRNDGLDPESMPPPFNEEIYKAIFYPDLAYYQGDSYTDWQDRLIGGTAKYTDANLSISGGSQNTRYIISSNYKRQTSVFPDNSNDQKASVHFNLANSSPNQKLRIKFTSSYLIDKNKLPGEDLTDKALRLSPNAPALYNEDGSLNFFPSENGVSTFNSNPLRSSHNRYKTTTKNLLTSFNLNYQIARGLGVQTNIGYSDMQIDEVATFPMTSVPPENRAYSERVADYSNGNTSSWIFEPQMTFNTKISKGSFEVLVGSTLNQRSSQRQAIHAAGFQSDLALEDINSASSLSRRGSTNATYKYIAVFTRMNYNWQNKYIINLTSRRDGSSRFGSANRFHNFGSAAVAWIFTNEDNVKSEIPCLSFGKITASWGGTGSDQIGDYQYLNIYTPQFGVSRPYALRILICNGKQLAKRISD